MAFDNILKSHFEILRLLKVSCVVLLRCIPRPKKLFSVFRTKKIFNNIFKNALKSFKKNNYSVFFYKHLRCVFVKNTLKFC